MKTHLLLSLFIILLCACSPNKQTERLFLQADSLMEAQPDSALRLLQILPTSQKLSTRETARYALLLARATDKCKMSLLPCDSLLNIALNYYGSDDIERATALLYRGRMELEMEQSEKAIEYLLEGLDIIKKFPKKNEIKRHILSTLGNEYYNSALYKEAGNTYRELYKYCVRDRDKSIALNALSSYYSIIEEEDSALIYQRKALDYARASQDSTIIATSELNLSVKIEYVDSAISHAQMAIKWLPENENPSLYYGNIGDLFLENGNIDSATYYLNKSLENSPSMERKAYTMLNLYEIKKEQGDYKAASEYLIEHSYIVDSLYSIEQSTKIEQLIHEYDTKIRVNKEYVIGKQKLYKAITSFIVFCLILSLFFQYHINKREKEKILYQQTLKQTQDKLLSMQIIIAENQNTIAFLQEECRILKIDQQKKLEEILEREATIEKMKTEERSLQNWLFKQSAIYQRISSLTQQDNPHKKEWKVLLDSEQKKLKKDIFEIYVSYIHTILTKYPKLTEEDLIYLCLNEAGLSSQAITLCFGSADIHTIAQRKYRIKLRMKQGNAKV